MASVDYIIRTGGLELTQDSGLVVGFTIKRSGNRSSQSATVTLSNETGDLWEDDFQARQPLTIDLFDGDIYVNSFDGYVDHLAVGEGNPGHITIECAGRTMRLKDSEVRPLVYDESLDEDERDGPGVVVQVSGGQIQLPTDALHSPIDQLIGITIDGEPILALNLDPEGGVIYVDGTYNGQTAVVSYTAFKARYEAEAASDIASDLMARYGPGFGVTGIEGIATTLTFEPSRFSDLYTELGRLRDQLGGVHDFFLDRDDELQFYAKDAEPIAIVGSMDVRTAQFSVDYTAYANKVTVRSSDAKTNEIAPPAGPFQSVIEGTSPTGTMADQVAQGFKALDTTADNFRVLAKRATEEDAVDWSVQYNGKRPAISESFDSAHSLTPDSTNIAIDAANDRIHVAANGSGTAYFSSRWAADLTQSTDSTTSSVTTASNIYQTITVADLSSTTLKGIAFKTASAANGVTFKVHSGSAGNAGALLGTSEPVLLSDADNEMEADWFAAYFTDAIDLSGETTVSIVPNTDAGTFAWARNAADVYAGGASSEGGDFAFQLLTASTLQDLLAGFAIWDYTAAPAANRVPRIYIARDYSIGDPDSANWLEVLSNQPRLFTGAAGDRFGIKVEFNSNSITTDPLVASVTGAVAYLAADAALDEPSGITVGSLFGQFDAGALPFYNEDSGTLTQPISMDPLTRLEPDGNYWLVLSDGNDDDSGDVGVSHFTAFYDDGASATYTEDWANTGAVSTSTNLDNVDSGIAITRNAKAASLVTSDVLGPTANQITAALVTSDETAQGGRVFQMVSRNRRNYYDPERSTDTSKAASNTGELLILQFDDGDFTTVAGGGSRVTDQTGNGFDCLVRTLAKNPTGKYGGGINTATATFGGGAAVQGVSGASPWLKADASFQFHYKPTAALADDRGLFAIADVAIAPNINIMLSTMASGQVKLTHTYDSGASTETHTTDNTNSAAVLTNGAFTRIGVKRTGSSTVSIYFDGALKNTFTLANPPDTVPPRTATRGGVQSSPDLVLWFSSTGSLPDPPTGVMDEFRAWPRVVEDWVFDHVGTYAYRNVGAKFTFPAEADGTDTYTTADAADATMKNLRIAQFLWPSFNYESGIRLRLGMDYANTLANVIADPYVDLSSYAHSVTASNLSSVDFVAGAFGEALDLNGSNENLQVANDGNLNFGAEFTWMNYAKFPSAAVAGTMFHKRGEAKATYDNGTYAIELTCQGAVTRSLSVAATTTNGTNYHLAFRYDGTTLDIIRDGAVIATEDFGSHLAVASSQEDLYIGCENPTGATKSNFLAVILDEVTLTDYAATLAQIAELDNDPSAGLRSPIQAGYVVAAYDGTATSAYPDGKYLVSRTDGSTWTDLIDGSNSNPYATLSFRMEFGKENVQCIRRNAAEIARAGMEVGRVFNVPATDKATLCSMADGLLALLSDGLAKGQIGLDGLTDWDVGDSITVNYPEKGQVFVDYAIATVELTVGEGDFRVSIGLGEEERSLVALFGTAEVGIQ